MRKHVEKSLKDEGAAEVVFDLSEVGFVPSHLLKTSFVNKIKMSDNHNLVAFTIDIGNTEFLTGGVKDMTTNSVLPNLILKNVG